MNRRTSVKGILGISFLSVSSFSIYKWINLNRQINLSSLISYRSLISELADTIIPKTDTPGAKEAGVENYIINVLLDCANKREQNKFLNGLLDVEEYSDNIFGKSFIKCSSEEKIAILTHFEKKDKFSISILNKINNKFLGKPFFSQLKSLTIEGYCTSEIGATQALAYDFIPGAYKACISLNIHQKSWATK